MCNFFDDGKDSATFVVSAREMTKRIKKEAASLALEEVCFTLQLQFNLVYFSNSEGSQTPNILRISVVGKWSYQNVLRIYLSKNTFSSYLSLLTISHRSTVRLLSQLSAKTPYLALRQRCGNLCIHSFSIAYIN